jgi:hypothetical protein
MVYEPLFPTIRSISISGGFMEGLKIDFAQGLNCIIGARDTGKTTIIEMMRYALNGDAILTDKAAGNRLKSLISKKLPWRVDKPPSGNRQRPSIPHHTGKGYRIPD